MLEILFFFFFCRVLEAGMPYNVFHLFHSCNIITCGACHDLLFWMFAVKLRVINLFERNYHKVIINHIYFIDYLSYCGIVLEVES